MIQVENLQDSNKLYKNKTLPEGEFVTRGDERFYAIYNVDEMAPFFISIVSPDDHWLFVSSTGGLTAGRVSPETALFPYIPVDRIHESYLHTGPKTIIKCLTANGTAFWEPFNQEQYGKYEVQRNLYRNTLGNKICFEEINRDLNLMFRYTWETSDEFGFNRHCEITNDGEQERVVELIDGLQNILPSGTPRFTQTASSNLVDAYKWSELAADSGLAMFTLYSGITDRAEPCESLTANVAYVLGLASKNILLSSEQLNAFKAGKLITEESSKRGVRGAFLVQFSAHIKAGESKEWRIVTDIDLSQSKVVSLLNRLDSDEGQFIQSVTDAIEDGSDRLARIMAASDGFQATAEENVAEHHYANVLYNVMRGGIFNQQYVVTRSDILATIKRFNVDVFKQNKDFLEQLPEQLRFNEFLSHVTLRQDPQLLRLCQEYLPITFGRRHGDPSRPWNQFAINLKDEQGNSLLSYQGNWRDIFQNWEALALSYPDFVEGMIAKFVNASTIDGYNPYRVTKEGIDWEVEEPDDPWSYIGYWGDHQIIYLLKLLELSNQFNPEKLGQLLHSDTFCYANVPYKIKSFAQLLENAKDTVYYDEDLALEIEKRVKRIGSDGKMWLNADGDVYQVNLLEKLLVPLLTKLSNLVLDGGIWLNTQRPEWNDANNAIVGQGLSMVTLYYMRRYVAFMQGLLAEQTDTFTLTAEIAQWLNSTSDILARVSSQLTLGQKVSSQFRFSVLEELGQAASTYREQVYGNGVSNRVNQGLSTVHSLLNNALTAIDHCISTNRTNEGLFHAYNLLSVNSNECEVGYLYPMLEGQVSALSTGEIKPEVACDVLEKLFASDVYRADQNTFMLYPDKEQQPFLQKNSISITDAMDIPLLRTMLKAKDTRVVEEDQNGVIRFNAAIGNAGDLAERLTACSEYSQPELNESSNAILALYEKVFKHQAFTGRSGGMFGFEGLGCIYWHMVSKLLVSTYENFYAAVEDNQQPETIQKLGQLYYRVREGIGFNKTPSEYGAFPTDPYSHTPKHAGAQQPGMTGQVKEELISRLGELGVRVNQGKAHFNPALLRTQEFSVTSQEFKYLDVNDNWQTLLLDSNTLGFTWCQLPIVYHLDDKQKAGIKLTFSDGSTQSRESLELNQNESRHLFDRDNAIQKIDVTLNSNMLLQ